jgi:ribonuclease R
MEKQFKNRKPHFTSPPILHTAPGKLSLHPDGFGFFNADTAEMTSIFIPNQKTGGTLPDDRVEVTWDTSRDKPFALSLSVLSRAARDFAMVTTKTAQGVSLVPFSPWLVNFKCDIPTELSKAVNDSVQGDLWRVSFDGKDLGSTLKVTVLECVGNLYTIKGRHTANLIDGGHEWSAPPTPAQFVDKDAALRTDWTSHTFVTVDGKNTKDFDDAVNVSASNQGWVVRVAIADVSAYVEEGSDLDLAAKLRGSTVYLPSDVRPMFTSELADGVCSLVEKEPRAVLGVTLRYDLNGVMTHPPEFEQATICVARRCLFEELEHWASEGIAPPNASDAVLDVFSNWQSWLSGQEKQEDMTFPWQQSEHYIVVSDDLRVECVQNEPTPLASKMVERAMVAANRAAAQFLHQAHGVGAFRNHQEPDWSKGQEALEKVEWEGEYPPKGNAKDWWVKAFEKFKGKSESWILAKAWAQMQTKASYEVSNQGHHALAADAYTHFTSPIRRYADVAVHRAIKSVLQKTPFDAAQWESVVLACNQANKRSRTIERGVRQYWMAKWWSQQPKFTPTEGVVRAVKKDGTAVVNTQTFGSSGLVVPQFNASGHEEDDWAVGQRLLLECTDVKDSTVYFRTRRPK